MKKRTGRAERLREAAERLRGEAAKSKTPYTRDVRMEAAKRLAEEAHDHDMAMARWDAYESPPVLEYKRRKVGNVLAEAEDRAAIRHEVAEPGEYTSPAQLALARAADPEAVRREMAWADTDGQPKEGWLGT